MFVMCIEDIDSLLLKKTLVEPMTMILDQGLQLRALEDAEGRLEETLIEVLVVHRAELLNDEADR